MSPRCWIIDPIDGTKNYVRGVPVWATLIGLMADGEVTVGVVTAPALGRRWWAAQDGGAWTGRSLTKAAACRVSEVTRLEDASLSYSDLATWEQTGRLESFLGLARSVWRTRAYGDFWSHVLVAEGAVDISARRRCCSGTRPRCRSLSRRPEESSATRPVRTRQRQRCSNGQPHDEVLALLATCRESPTPAGTTGWLHQLSKLAPGLPRSLALGFGLNDAGVRITSSQACPLCWHRRHRPLAELLRSRNGE